MSTHVQFLGQTQLGDLGVSRSPDLGCGIIYRFNFDSETYRLERVQATTGDVFALLRLGAL